MRGIFACIVVFDHVAAECCPHALVFSRFIYWGDLAVAVFFGLSGYGLMKQLNGNHDYMKRFWPNRLAKLLPVYVIMTCFALGQGMRGDFNVLHRIVTKLSVVDAGWYCCVLLIFYLIFWLGNRGEQTNDGAGPLFAVVGVLIWSAVSSLFLEPFCYVRNGAFAIGLLIGWKSDSAYLLLRKYRRLVSVLGLWLVIIYSNYSLFMLQGPLAKYVNCAMWVLVVVAISMKVQFGNVALRYLGRISYEIYLSHMFVLGELLHWFPQRQSSWLVFATIGGTLAMATALHWIVGKVFPARKVRTV